MSLLSKINAIPGLFWYKLALAVAIAIGYTLFVYNKGVHNAELKCEQQKTEQAEARTIEVIKEVEKRVPVVQTIEVESAAQRAEIRRLKGKLDEALNQRSENPSCDLSDDEFDGVRDLSRQTHTSR